MIIWIDASVDIVIRRTPQLPLWTTMRNERQTRKLNLDSVGSNKHASDEKCILTNDGAFRRRILDK
jgi:hypothetical protein